MNWFKKFMGKLGRLGRQSVPFPTAVLPAVPSIPLVAKWTEEDRDQLARFLSGETGLKLTARLTATAYRQALDNAKQPDYTHSAGVSVGYDACRRHIAMLAKLSQAEPPKVAEDENELEQLLRRYSA